MFLPSVPQGAKKDRIRGDEHMAIVECASPLIISEAPYCPAHADLLVQRWPTGVHAAWLTTRQGLEHAQFVDGADAQGVLLCGQG